METKTKIFESAENLWLITEALEEKINVLRNRFQEDPKFVHPAEKYEKLLTQLKEKEGKE